MRLHPKNLNVGDVFYESAYGIDLKMTVVEPVTHENGKWNWIAENKDGTRCNYLITDGYEHYGPKLYAEPQYGNVK